MLYSNLKRKAIAKKKIDMLKKIVLVLLVSIVFSCEQQSETKEILFVCTHGAARSPIAAAYFNKMAEERNLNYRAFFRGTEPDSLLTPETIAGLTKDGFDISDWKPEPVAENDITNAHSIITFDCKLPSTENIDTTAQWNGTPSISKDYDIARNAIKERVNRLIETLAASPVEE